MQRKDVTILHLDERRLRWARIEAGAAHAHSVRTGTIEGGGIESLDAWLRQNGAPEGEVFLYDGRPVYYAFDVSVPAKARKQTRSIVGLKIRQELGVGEDAVYWSTRSRRSAGDRSTLDVSAFVARRGAFEDVLAWRARNGLDAMWIGADVSAVESLVRCGLAPESSVIVDADASGATVYRVHPDRPVEKRRLDTSDSDRANFQSNGASHRVDFGARTNTAFDAHPALRGLVPTGEFSEHAARRAHLDSASIQSLRFDPVILGACAALAHAELEMPSLAPVARVDKRVDAREPLRLRWIAPFAALSALALVASVIHVRSTREEARLDLIKKANAVDSATVRLKSQEAALRQIQAERAPLMPVFRALHEAMSQGVTLKSLSVNETGAVQLEGVGQDQGAPARIAADLAKNALFESVVLSEVRAGGQDNRQFTFQISLRIKDRARGR